MVAVQRLAAAARVDMQWVRARPPPDPWNQVPLAEVHQPDLFVGLLAREAHGLAGREARGRLVHQRGLLRAVGVVRADLDEVAAGQVQDRRRRADQVADRDRDSAVAQEVRVERVVAPHHARTCDQNCVSVPKRPGS